MIRTTKREIIYLPPIKRDALCAALGVSKKTYYNAVNGFTNSDSAEKIRKEALDLYGGEVITKTIIIGK
jgi:hypothetical protein